MATEKPQTPETPSSDHWLVRPDTIRKIWIISLAVLALTVLADLTYTKHPTFGIEGTFGFGAWFGFLSCVILVVGSKAFGAILKQPDTYYDR